MKVFLTGGRGLVGRAIQAHPESAKHRILAPTHAELDLTCRPAVMAAIAGEKPDLIIHAAGRVGGIQANMANPVAFMVDNMDMGLNIVQAARAAGVPQLLNIGSSCMYPAGARNPLREESLGSGRPEPTNEGYALAKVAVARLCDFVSGEDPALAFKTIVPCNLYGIHDKFDSKVSHLLPAVIRKVHEAHESGAETVEIWGDGTARREFMFSADLADAVWAAAVRFYDLPAIMNVGPGHDHSVDDYYAAVARVIGWRGRFVHDASRPAGIRRKLLDITRQTGFGWMPKISLDEGIRTTYAHLLETLARDAA